MYEELSGLCGVLKRKCIYNPAWVTLHTEGCNFANFKWRVHNFKTSKPSKTSDLPQRSGR